MPGDRLGIDRYELLRPLGSGGMGTVFEARDRSTGARLAIKALHEGAGDTLYQFKHEFRVLSELSHPFLVRFGELFEDAGRFYLTMELVEGHNFLDHVRPGASSHRESLAATAPHDGVLDVQRLRQALAQLSSGLMALHASGFIHRDVKPQNVLVSHEGRVVLLDFGVAVNRDAAQRPELAGTLEYMAPEQFAAGGVTQATDWYAVGVVLYEALSGRLPYAGIPLWSQARRAPPPPPEAVAGGRIVPEDLSLLCRGLMDPDPARRFDEEAIARFLGLDASAERSRASFRSQLHFSPSVFVNRRKELYLLREARSHAWSDGCTIVRIRGDSGVGKSALLRAWLGELEAEPDVKIVLSSRCYERETLPYRGVDGVIDALARKLGDAAYRNEPVPEPRDAALLGHVFPVLKALSVFGSAAGADIVTQDPQEARRLAFLALRDLFAGLTATCPLIVHVDDAQWIDPESVALLSFLVVGENAPRMLLIFTERPSVPDPLAGLLQSGRPVTSVELLPLDLDESQRLASQLLVQRGGGSAALAATVAQMSGGHPLFIHELILHAEPGARAGASLETAVSARIAQLDPKSRHLLDIVALASSPPSHEVARAASGLDPGVYPWALSTLRSENLVTYQGLAPKDAVHPCHDRIRELVVATMDEDVRKGLHGRLADSIEALAPDALDALAYHFFEAGVPGKAARYARSAAERALEKLAFEHAARLFELALRVEVDPAARASLEERLGKALADAGRGVDAAEAYLRASRGTAPMRAPASNELRRRAGEQLFRAGHVERAMGILTEILRDLGLRIPATDLETASSLARALVRLQARLYLRGLRFTPRPPSAATPEERLRLDACWTVATGLSMVHHLRATDFQARSLLLALAVGEEQRVLRSAALLSVSLSADVTGRRIARRLMEGALKLAARAPSPDNAAWLELTAGVTAMGSWNFERSLESCERAEAIFRSQGEGVAWEIVSSQAFALWSMVFQGKLKSAAERLPDLLASARARGDRHALATLTLSPLHLVGLAADEPERVRTECTVIAGEWPPNFACFQHMCAAYVLAHVDLYEDRPQSAWDHVVHAWRMLRRSHLSRVQFQRIDLLGLRARAALGLAALDGGVDRRWLARARADARRLERVAIDPALGIASLVFGTALYIEGKRPEALARFEDASARFDARGMRLHSAVALLARDVAAVGAARAGEGAAARRLLALGVARPLFMLRVWAPGMRK
jgi:hypothetical protein